MVEAKRIKGSQFKQSQVIQESELTSHDEVAEDNDYELDEFTSDEEKRAAALRKRNRGSGPTVVDHLEESSGDESSSDEQYFRPRPAKKSG